MGSVKRWWMLEESLGWTRVGNKHVCGGCFGDYAIKDFIQQNAESTKCDYCCRESEDDKPIAAPIDAVMAVIVDGIEFEWADPNNDGVSWESAEGGWQWTVYDSWDLIYDHISYEMEIDNEALLEDIVKALSDRQWCEKDHLLLRPEEQMTSNWETVASLVQICSSSRGRFADISS